MKTAVLTFGLMSIAATAAVMAQAPAAKAETPGQQLADLLDPVDLLVAMDGRLFRQSVEATVAQQPELAAMAQKEPKQLDAILNAGQKAEAVILRREYPAEQAKIGAMFDQALTPADFGPLLSYYRSPLGKKVVALGFAGMNRAGNSLPATRQGAMENTARLSMVSQLSSEERQQMIAFAQTPAVQHFEPANAERRQMRTAWAQSLMPEIQQASGAAMDAAASQFNAHPGSAR